MRPKILTSWLVPVLLLSPLACVSTDADGSASAPAADAQPAEAGDKAEKKADKAAAKSGGGGDKTAAAKKAGEKKSDKDEEKEKKDKAQKKWDEALKDLEKSTGLFTMHHGEQKLLLELDEKSLGREFLYYGALNSGAGSGSIYRGAMLYDNPNVLQFAKRGKKKVILSAENTNFLPGEDPRESRMLDEVLSKGIVNSFDIVAELEDEGRVLVDLGGWFMKDNLKLARSMGKVAPNKDLSLVSAVKAFPRNVEVHIALVFTGEARGNSVLADSRSVELAVQHSFVALPDPGYKPRKFDQRVGYFYTERKNLFDRQADDNVHRYINRWRLTKKDPTAEVSDPVEPIVYWIENSTPKAYRQAIREGIEAWEPAFRKAGFSNAIIAKQMPDDATWDAADVDYAVIRWSGDENVGFAIGPSRQDPRTGETFDADITMQANFLNTYAQRFKTYIEKRTTMSKEDILAEWKEAQKPFDAQQHRDPRAMCQMMGEEFALQVAYAAMLLDVVAPEKTEQEFLQDMIREVSAHEVGHTLGLRHNFKSSTLHDLDDLWNAETTMKEGVAGSFMDYPAVLIAHPDKTQGEFFQSVVGPYDYWAIEYGYTEFGSNEDAHLEAIANRSNEPGLEYGTDEDSFIGDPYTVVWDMGKNPVAFAEQQLELAEWGLSQMMERAAESGDGFHKYARYYSMFYSMYARNHFGLDRFIGGYTFNRDLVGQEGGRAPIVAIDPALQKQALDVMIDKGLTWSGGIPDEQRLLLANRKYGSFGSWFDFWSFDPLPRIVNSARFSSLLPLMNPSMMERLQAQNILVPDSVTPREVATRVFQTVWVDTPDEHDLWLQADYVDLAIAGLERDSPPQVKALFDGLVRQSKAQLDTYAANADPTIAAHGRWLGDRITRYRERSKVEF